MTVCLSMLSTLHDTSFYSCWVTFMLMINAQGKLEGFCVFMHAFTFTLHQAEETKIKFTLTIRQVQWTKIKTKPYKHMQLKTLSKHM